MIELFKEMWEAAGQRLRSPFFGSILFSFVAVNWEALFFLFFAEQKAEVRLAYFTSITDWKSLYAMPFVLGVLLAWAMPWLKYCGAWVAQFPNKRLHRLQNIEAVSREIVVLNEEKRKVDAQTELTVAQEEGQARIDAEAENRKIEAARRLKQAEELGEEAKAEILEDRKAESKESSLELSEIDLFIILQLGRNQNMLSLAHLTENIQKDPYVDPGFRNPTKIRYQTEIASSLENLRIQKLVKTATQAGVEVFGLTKSGYDQFEHLDMLHSG